MSQNQTASPLTPEQVVNGHGKVDGIISIKANYKGGATLYRRVEDLIVTNQDTFDPFVLLCDERILKGLEGVMVIELQGDLPFKWKLKINNSNKFKTTLFENYNRIYNTQVIQINEVKCIKRFNLAEQYLLQSGNTYYKGRNWEDIKQVILDIETTGLNPEEDKVFAIGLKIAGGEAIIIHSEDEREVLEQLNNEIHSLDPDVIVGHNIFEFDLPFLKKRYEKHFIGMKWSRDGNTHFIYDDSLKVAEKTERFTRTVIGGREVVDTMHAAKRYDGITREFSGISKLKHVAKVLNVARSEDDYVEGSKIYETYRKDSDKVIRYLEADLQETEDINRILMQDKFVLSKMLPMEYEKVATTGSTKPWELAMARSYLQRNHSLPVPTIKKEKFQGAIVAVRATGVFYNVIKIDVASMYPSILLEQHIAPDNDPLGVFQLLLKNYTELRLKYKKLSKTDPKYTPLQKALKILINSAYGVLGNERFLFNSPTGAARVTEQGRRIISYIEQLIIKFGGIPLEIDTDGVLCVLPDDKILPSKFAEMVNNNLTEHSGITVEPEDSDVYKSVYIYKCKNYALLTADGKIKLVGAAFKGRTIQPIFRGLIEHSIKCILNNDIDAFVDYYQCIYKKIADGHATQDDLVETKKLGKSLKEYQETSKSKLPHYYVLEDIGMKDAKEGHQSQYYKSQDKYKHISKFENDYDTKHYIRALNKKIEIFRFAFPENDFNAIIDGRCNVEDISLSNMAVVTSPTKQYINLTADIKAKDGYVDRKTIVEIGDSHTIDSFYEKHQHTDIYCSAFAFSDSSRPKKFDTKNLSKLPQLGDFYLELEGGFADEILSKAYKAMYRARKIVIDELKVPLSGVKLYFNGGKSFYLLISYKFFIEKAVHSLNAKYAELVKFIDSKMPEEFSNIIDHRINSITGLLRVRGSRYPDGAWFTEIPPEFNENTSIVEELHGIAHTSATNEPFNFFLPFSPEEETVSSRKIFNEVTKRTRFKTYRKRQLYRKEKNKIIDSYLSAHPEKYSPCLKSLAVAIADGESIGFGGRCKFVYEAKRHGLTEKQIVEIFLLNNEPKRYGVLNEQYGGNFTINEKYNLSLVTDTDCGHPDLAPVCNPSKCYREALKPIFEGASINSDSPSFKEFQLEARKYLKEKLCQYSV